MSYNVNFVLGLSAASLAVFAEKELRKVTDEEKLSGPCINRIRDISLIALYSKKSIFQIIFQEFF